MYMSETMSREPMPESDLSEKDEDTVQKKTMSAEEGFKWKGA